MNGTPLLRQAPADVQGMVEKVAMTLAAVTQNASVASAPHGTQARVKHVDLVSLEPTEVLLILLLEGNLLRQQVLTVTEVAAQPMLSKLAARLNTTLGGINSDVTPGLKKTLEDMQRVIATADDVLKRGVSGTLDQVNAALEDLRRPLATADAVLKNADTTLLGQNAPVQQDLRDALQEITLAARSLRALMDYLERHPESLIRGKTKQENP